MREAGTLVPQKIEPLMPVIEQNPPVLRQFDHCGQRVDEVDYHPFFREVERTEHGFGLVRMGNIPGWRELPGRAPAGVHVGVEYLFLQADQPICACPVGMASAMCRALRRNDPALAAEWVPRIASDDPQGYLTAAMFMTERPAVPTSAQLSVWRCGRMTGPGASMARSGSAATPPPTWPWSWPGPRAPARAPGGWVSS